MIEQKSFLKESVPEAMVKMKKIFFFITTTFCLSCSAQLAPHPAGSYITNGFLDKFVGTWVWVSGTDTMQIVLQKQKIHFLAPLNYDQDLLVGWHKYVKNGMLVESSLQYIGSSYDSGHTTLLGTTQTKSRIRFTTFKDLSKNKTSDECYLAYVEGTPAQGTWTLRNSEGLKKGGFDHGFTMPTSLIFTKQ